MPSVTRRGLPFAPKIGAIVGAATALAVASGAGVLAQTASFDEIWRLYRSGNADRAISLVSGWDERRAAREMVLSGDADPWDLASLALFHGELSARGSRAPRTHTERSLSIVEDLCDRAARTGDARLREFCRQFLTALLCLDFTDRVWASLDRRFREDAHALLVLGARKEYAMPRVESVPGGYGFGDERVVHVTQHGRFGPEADVAIDYLQRALARDPGLAEAGVHLGRVLYLLDRRPEAARVLGAAFETARAGHQREVAYLAQLFLGWVREADGDQDAAIVAYRAAIDVLPTAQTAAAALSRQLLGRGLTDEAASVVARATSPSAKLADPWTSYFRPQICGPELAARYRALREALTR